MNNMNKVFIEGKVVMSSVDFVKDEECYFTVKATRSYKKDGKGVTEEHFIPVRVESNLVGLVRGKFEQGKNEVRIEGRLDTTQGMLVKVDYIEFKKNYVEGENE